MPRLNTSRKSELILSMIVRKNHEFRSYILGRLFENKSYIVLAANEQLIMCWIPSPPHSVWFLLSGQSDATEVKDGLEVTVW